MWSSVRIRAFSSLTARVGGRVGQVQANDVADILGEIATFDGFHESCLLRINPNARHTRDTVDRCSVIDRFDQWVAFLGVVSRLP